MSDSKTVGLKGETRPATAWGHGQIIRPLGESLAYQLRRFSLTNKPTIVKLLPVWDDEEDGEGNDRSSGLSIRAGSDAPSSATHGAAGTSSSSTKNANATPSAHSEASASKAVSGSSRRKARSGMVSLMMHHHSLITRTLAQQKTRHPEVQRRRHPGRGQMR